MKPMNPLTEAASFLNCFSQCLFVVHSGNSLVYAFAEISIEQTNTQDIFIFCMQIFVLTKHQTGLF